MAEKTLKRNIFQRLLGIPATKLPTNPDCWQFTDGTLTVDLDKTPELSENAGGIRIENETLPEKVLVIRGVDGQFHAFRNKCGHGGRRLDPMPDAESVQCCSVGKTTCDYHGKVLSGSATEPLVAYPVEVDGNKLDIKVS